MLGCHKIRTIFCDEFVLCVSPLSYRLIGRCRGLSPGVAGGVAGAAIDCPIRYAPNGRIVRSCGCGARRNEPGALRARRLSARRGGSGVLAHAKSRAGGGFPPSKFQEKKRKSAVASLGWGASGTVRGAVRANRVLGSDRVGVCGHRRRWNAKNWRGLGSFGRRDRWGRRGG